MSDEKPADKVSLKNHPVVLRVKQNLRIQKVVATRSVKGPRGDHYVGFSAAWNTTQDDAGGGASLISAQDDLDTSIAVEQGGMTLQESKVAALMLGMQADIAAHKNAYAGGNANADQLNNAIKVIRTSYSKLLLDLLNEEPPRS
jgi:hypothetical protein